MSTRRKKNLLLTMQFLLVFTALTCQTLVAYAQRKSDNRNVYKGFTASFGTRSLAMASDIAELHGKNLIETGGLLGVIYGNDVLRLRIGIFGYYSSAANTPGTTTLYTSSAAVNIYPLHLLNEGQNLLEPYFTGGLAYDRFNFFGFYIDKEPGVTNYSQAEAPFLGQVKQVNTAAGLGLEMRLKNDYDFVHLFTEARYVYNVSSNSRHQEFSKTDLLNRMHVVLGVTFGAIR